MASLATLPEELLLAVLTEAAKVRNIKRALRLRLVCKVFDARIKPAIFRSGVLDSVESAYGMGNSRELWAEYLAYRTLKTTGVKSWDMRTLLLCAKHICRSRHASPDGESVVEKQAITETELGECVTELCRSVVHNNTYSGGSTRPRSIHDCFLDTSTPVTSVDESSLYFKCELLSAACWMGMQSLATTLIEEGYVGTRHGFGYCLLLGPPRAAAYKNHIAIVKACVANDSLSDNKWALFRRAKATTDFAMMNDHVELLDITLDTSSQWDPPASTHNLRIRALRMTRNVHTFTRLLRVVRPYIATPMSPNETEHGNQMRWFYWWLCDAAAEGKVEIVKYLVEEEGASVNNSRKNDFSMFKSRHPAELDLKGPFRQFGTNNFYAEPKVQPLTFAAAKGHLDVVKFLLAAGAKLDRAIQYAAGCGSRAIVRTLWEHGESDESAVQGAFLLAVVRENADMFRLLVELGAKLADDVRVTARAMAEEQGLESMVHLLDEHAEGQLPLLESSTQAPTESV